MPDQSRFRFRINLSAEEYLRYYQGRAGAVIVQSEDGRRIQLPAARLRPFVMQEGVRGRFEITLDGNNRLQRIERLPE